MPHEHDTYINGNGGAASDGSEGEEEPGEEEELSLVDPEAPARALAALNALRKSRQHYDVVLVAAGGEEPAHRAVLAAASPYLLHALPPAPAPPASPASPLAPPAYRLPDVEAGALPALLDYVYTGRLAVRSAAQALALYRAAWRLRLEPPRLHLAARLLRRLAPATCLAVRALPDLPPPHLAALDQYIADNFDEVCRSGALAALPEVRIELIRETAFRGGDEAPAVVAEAALAWLRDHPAVDMEELCSRTHLVFVDGGGALRDCGEMPAAREDAPELQQYRAEAAARRRGPAAAPPPALPAHELGARAARDAAAVLAARRAQGGATRALLALRGRLLAARVLRSGVAGGPRGAALRGEPPGGERRARLAAPRAALGCAPLHDRLLVCGGYDRARVLRACEAYDPASNAWEPAAELRGPRARFSAARLGAAVYALGGSDGHAELDTVEVYSAEGGWRSGARLPLALSHAGAAADEARGALYVVGGWAAGACLRRVLRYAPGEGAWGEAPRLAGGRSQCAAVVWEGALWALGGCDAWHCLASTERLALDEAGAEWAPGPALPTARRSMGGCVWRGRLVSAGGSDGAASLRRTEWLEAGAGRGAGWRGGPALRRARAALGLGVVRDVLYAAGGFDGKEFLACVECLYSPDGEWTELCDAPRPAPALPDARDSPDSKERAQEAQ